MQMGRYTLVPRRASKEHWAIVNPVLREEEPGVDQTNREVRIGDGTTAWLDLPVATGEDALNLLLRAAGV